MDRKQLLKSFERWFLKEGFVRKGKVWYLRSADAIGVFEFQKSDWSNYYFLNVAFCLKSLGCSDNPQEKDCQIRIRADKLFPDWAGKLDLVCDLDEHKGEDGEKEQYISVFLRENLIPFIKDNIVLCNLKKSIDNDRFRKGFIHKDVRRLLMGVICRES